MMVRGGGLAASMSRYLIERIEATPNIELMTNTEMVALEGDAGDGLERVRWREPARAARETSGDDPQRLSVRRRRSGDRLARRLRRRRSTRPASW